MNSSNPSKLSAGLRLQLSAQYGRPREDLIIVQFRIQQQIPQLGNCGLFSIANVYDFCLKNRVGQASVDFDEPMLRPHLIKCLENEMIDDFPLVSRMKRLGLKKKNAFTIPISCKCGIADEFEDMVCCDKVGCEKWYHYSCGNSDGTPNVKKWICPECKK